MAITWRFMLVFAAFVLLFLAAFNVPTPPRINLAYLGLALLAMSFIVVS